MAVAGLHGLPSLSTTRAASWRFNCPRPDSKSLTAEEERPGQMESERRTAAPRQAAHVALSGRFLTSRQMLDCDIRPCPHRMACAPTPQVWTRRGCDFPDPTDL